MDRREFMGKAALIGAAPFVLPSTIFAAVDATAPYPAPKERPIGDLYDATTIQPLLVDFLKSFVPELQRRGYYTWFDDRYSHIQYMADLKVAWDPVVVKTTRSSVHASYVIDGNSPALRVSVSPYRLHDTCFTEGWKRRSMEEFVLMFQTADRVPVFAQIIEKFKEPGRVPE